jgi:hypothetical protein
MPVRTLPPTARASEAPLPSRGFSPCLCERVTRNQAEERDDDGEQWQGRTSSAVDVGGSGVGAIELDNPVDGWEIKAPARSLGRVCVEAMWVHDLAATSVAKRTAESRLQKS